MFGYQNFRYEKTKLGTQTSIDHRWKFRAISILVQKSRFLPFLAVCPFFGARRAKSDFFISKNHISEPRASIFAIFGYVMWNFPRNPIKLFPDKGSLVQTPRKQHLKFSYDFFKCLARFLGLQNNFPRKPSSLPFFCGVERQNRFTGWGDMIFWKMWFLWKLSKNVIFRTTLIREESP